MNSLSGWRSRCCISDSRRRPRRQVIISVNTTIATTSGSQPPSWILNTLAENSSTSNSSRRPNATSHSIRLAPVLPRGSTAKASTEVVSMVPVTAKP